MPGILEHYQNSLISMSEIYEVASFYAHFRIIDEDDIKVPDSYYKGM